MAFYSRRVTAAYAELFQQHGARFFLSFNCHFGCPYVNSTRCACASTATAYECTQCIHTARVRASFALTLKLSQLMLAHKLSLLRSLSPSLALSLPPYLSSAFGAFVLVGELESVNRLRVTQTRNLFHSMLCIIPFHSV